MTETRPFWWINAGPCLRKFTRATHQQGRSDPTTVGFSGPRASWRDAFSVGKRGGWMHEWTQSWIVVGGYQLADFTTLFVLFFASCFYLLLFPVQASVFFFVLHVVGIFRL